MRTRFELCQTKMEWKFNSICMLVPSVDLETNRHNIVNTREGLCSEGFVELPTLTKARSYAIVLSAFI